MKTLKHLQSFLDSTRRASDVRCLVRHDPRLEAVAERAASARDVLADAHREYVGEVSSLRMAVSLETAGLLGAIIGLTRPRRILDLGSGFSSYVCRHPEWGATPDVTSVDDDEQWLDATVAYLDSQGVGSDKVVSWEAFRLESVPPFDLIFHDLGSMGTRFLALPRVLELGATTGLTLFDDTHKRRYAARLWWTLRQRGLSCHALVSLTRDDLGRYSSVLVRE